VQVCVCPGKPYYRDKMSPQICLYAKFWSLCGKYLIPIRKQVYKSYRMIFFLKMFCDKWFRGLNIQFVQYMSM